MSWTPPPRSVLGYHGCSQSTADRLLAGEAFKPSTNQYDWLGFGVYFWEFGIDRAAKWARKRFPSDSAVIGVEIDLNSCFDLLDTRNTNDLSEAAKLYKERMEFLGKPLPENRGGNHTLDCALIDFYLGMLADEGQHYAVVRGCFIEGNPIMPGMAIHTESHVQLAVRNQAAIGQRFGVFDFP